MLLCNDDVIVSRSHDWLGLVIASASHINNDKLDPAAGAIFALGPFSVRTENGALTSKNYYSALRVAE
jgi:hypothetical protein